MSEHTLKSIKRDSIRRVYDCISNSDSITRLEISQITGLSLMTVGKIADALLEKDIIILEKSNSAKIGRKSECIKLNNACVIIVLDEKCQSISLVNLELDITKISEYNDGEEAIKFLIDNSSDFKYLGIGVISNEKRTDLRENIKNFFGLSEITVIDEIYAKAVNGIMSLKAQSKSGIYIYSDKERTCGTYFDADTTVDGIKLGELHGNSVEEQILSIIAVSKFLNTNGIYLHSAESNMIKATEIINVCKEDSFVGAARAVIDNVINITKRL